MINTSSTSNTVEAIQAGTLRIKLSPPRSQTIYDPDMTRVRPSVFIGSSSEGLAVAQALQEALDWSCECEIWSQGMFGLGTGALESLVSALPRFDFAVLVVDADDSALSRGESKAVPRDNVVFELGLFMGALGSPRTFMVFDRTKPPNLPSDLGGVTAATYVPHSSGNLSAALGAATTKIQREITRLGLREDLVSHDVGAEDDSHASACELVDIYHRYSLCEESPEYLDMWYRRKQVVESKIAGGLSSWPLSFSKPSDKLPAFDPANPPTIELLTDKTYRDGPGSIKLSAPRKQVASSFALDLKFSPPLRSGEKVDYTVAGNFSKYRLARAASIREATRDTPVGERDFDYLSWKVNYPTRFLNLVVEIPANIGIEPLGPRSSLHNDDFPTASASIESLKQEYECTEVSAVGIRYMRMHLRVTEPKLQCRYRLAWRLS